MSNKAKLINKLQQVEQIATTSKIRRLLVHPFKYIFAILHRQLIYPKKGSKQVESATFFGTNMTLLLPASTDIYLTGGKSHSSEIRLARFIINTLQKGDCFIDVGAHYGYFSLLAATLVGTNGQVHAFEASQNTFTILQQNAKNKTNLSCFNQAISNEIGMTTFYEFPNLYSEYNSTNIQQFENTTWFKQLAPKKVEIETIDLNTFLEDMSLHPTLIKIDVEGAEFKVIQGAKAYLQQYQPLIAMEYLQAERGNAAHQQAATLLQSLGYKATTITKEGELIDCVDIDAYLATHGLESDNIVFKKL